MQIKFPEKKIFEEITNGLSVCYIIKNKMMKRRWRARINPITTVLVISWNTKNNHVIKKKAKA